VHNEISNESVESEPPLNDNHHYDNDHDHCDHHDHHHISSSCRILPWFLHSKLKSAVLWMLHDFMKNYGSSNFKDLEQFKLF
jgi:hypothetical protein